MPKSGPHASPSPVDPRDDPGGHITGGITGASEHERGDA